MANTCFVSPDLAGEDNEARDVTVKRSTLFGLAVCSSHVITDNLMHRISLTVCAQWCHLNILRCARNISETLEIRWELPHLINWTTSVNFTE